MIVLDFDANNISGTSWVDSSSSNNDGVLQGGALYNSSDGGFVRFDGVDDYVSTTNLINDPALFSVLVWIRTSVASGKKIIGFENNQTGESSSTYDRHIYINNLGKATWGVYDGSGKTSSSTTSIDDNEWHQIVGTYDNVSKIGRIYIDGVEEGNFSALYAQSYSGYWRIGSYRLGTWINGSDGYFNGDIAIVKIYDEVLDSTSILNDYNLTLPRFDEYSYFGNNYGHWKLNKGLKKRLFPNFSNFTKQRR